MTISSLGIPPEDGRTLSVDFTNLSTGLTDFPATSTRPTGAREDSTYNEITETAFSLSTFITINRVVVVVCVKSAPNTTYPFLLILYCA